MFRPRIVPVILIDNDGGCVKSIKFKKRKYIGDPVNTVSLFNSFSVDELVLLNVDSKLESFEVNFNLLQDIAQEARMPFSIGGGIRSLEDIRKILQLGAEKVIISSEALRRPSFLNEASKFFGSSSITVCLDIRKNFYGSYEAFNAKNKIKLNLNDALNLVENNGAGEVILQSINNDGLMNGYDSKLLEYASNYLKIPLVALGGASSVDEMLELNKTCNISAYAAGSLFIYQDKNHGVLINYPDTDDLKEFYLP